MKRSPRADDNKKQLTHYAEGGHLVELYRDSDGLLKFIHRPPGDEGFTTGHEKVSIGNLRITPLREPLILDGTLVLPPPPAEQTQDIQVLYRELLEFIWQHVTWEQDFLVTAAAYVLSTWVHQTFEFVGYLQFVGPPGSGKSRSIQVLEALCYHALSLADLTPAVAFRAVANYNPTLLIDEVDDELRSDVRAIMRRGSNKGGRIVRCRDGDYVPQSYSCFGPKVYAGQEPITDGALASRIIQHNMASVMPTPQIRPELADGFHEDARIMRSKLFRWAIDNYGRIRLHDPGGHDRRQRQVFAPLFSVSPSVLHGSLSAMMNRAGSAARNRMRDSLEGEVVAAVHQMGSPEIIRPIEVAKAVCAARGVDFEAKWDKDHVSREKAGHSLQRLGLTDRGRDDKGVFYRADKSALERLYQTYLPQENTKDNDDEEQDVPG